ncbi:MAG: FAD-binding protein [Bacteroidales bacterium]|nr:FAD-binding protein [Bacteroidales bacterium]
MKEVEVVFPAKFNPTEKDIVAACEKVLRARPGAVISHEVRKRSLDARGGEIKYRYRVNVALRGMEPIEPYKLQEFKDVHNAEPVIVVGCGPAGLFAALKLVQLGLKPIILERGKDVHQRKFDMAKLSKEQIVNPNSNYCFGEGGAGTFSDGKLYTRSTKKGDIREILHMFVHFGADPAILIESHAHIGSDKLPRVIENMRNCIIAHGGQVHFNSHVVDFTQTPTGWEAIVEDSNTPDSTSIPGGTSVPGNTSAHGGTSVHGEVSICGQNSQIGTSLHGEAPVCGQNGNLSGRKAYSAKNIILATGHSARDIYELFHAKGWTIEPKGFALGVRVEHPQTLINNIQYHGKYQPYLPTAEYSLVTQVDGRGVFSFCMCPGGILVPAATDRGEMVLNGMSNSARNSKWANAGVVVQVNPEDVPEFAEFGPLQVLRFQQSVEKKLFEYSNSIKAPAQRMEDFCKGTVSKDLPETSYKPGAYPAPLHELLPPFVATRLQKAFPEFNKKMRGYYTNKALLLAVESRTSSPVRIPRDKETLQHLDLPGIYPCGEGAGYAGGIVSSALDGVNCAMKIAGGTPLE